MLKKPMCDRKSFCGKYKYNKDCCLTCPLARHNRAASDSIAPDILTSGESGAVEFLPSSEGNLCAVDVGTTTVTAAIFDGTGKEVEKIGFMNPQKSFGTDVIARIEAANNGSLSEMRAMLFTELGSFIEGKDVRHMVIAGNTVMQHIAAGVSPYSIGVAPYAPQFTETREFPFSEAGLPGEGRVTLLPGVSGFIGADIVCGVLACGLQDKKENILFIDLGTNGEIILSKGGELYGCSTAAGPAFEGGNISCGSHAHERAICAARLEGGRITVDKPDGISISGSALIDLIAALLELGVVDETGMIDEDKAADTGVTLITVADEPAVSLNEKVYISQRDIREFQLAKSAVKAGILTLMDSAGIRAEEISVLYLAGGFGKGLNPVSADKIYMFPGALTGKTVAVGNTSFSGAVMCLLNRDTLTRVQALADSVHYVELTNNDKFYAFYTNSITFDDF